MPFPCFDDAAWKHLHGSAGVDLKSILEEFAQEASENDRG